MANQTRANKFSRFKWRHLAFASLVVGAGLFIGGRRCCVPSASVRLSANAPQIQGELLIAATKTKTASKPPENSVAPRGERVATPMTASQIQGELLIAATTTKTVSKASENSAAPVAITTTEAARNRRVETAASMRPAPNNAVLQKAESTLVVPPSISAAVVAAASPSPPVDEPVPVSFSLLGKYNVDHYKYQELIPQDGQSAALNEKIIPAEVRALDGRKVVIHGFIEPVDFDERHITNFMLLYDMVTMGCCFADAPRMNDWIDVKVAPQFHFSTFSYSPFVVTGSLSVGLEFRDGFLESVYRMTAENVRTAY